MDLLSNVKAGSAFDRPLPMGENEDRDSIQKCRSGMAVEGTEPIENSPEWEHENIGSAKEIAETEFILRLLLHHHYFNPTVYGPVATDAVVGDRLELAIGNGVHAVQRYTVLGV